MKILHLPNEHSNERNKLQLTSRKAFTNLLINNEIDEYKVYSFLYESQSKSPLTVEAEILDLVKNQKPDLIYWQHISEFNPSNSFYLKLKSTANKALLVYQDDDPYGPGIYKPITKEMKRIIQIADYCFISGTGNFMSLYKKYGAKNVLYLPHCFDTERTPAIWAPKETREIPLVMIGSMFHSKIPGKYLPGARTRRILAKTLNKEFGQRFYLFGQGWERYKLISSRGFLPFNNQFSTLKNAWLSVNWDHFDKEPCYCSNRLPISMASGTPHITNWHPGYNLLFKECKGGIYFSHSPKETVEIARYLLSQPKEFLIDEGKKAFDFVHKHFESTVVYRKMVQILKDKLKKKNVY